MHFGNQKDQEEVEVVELNDDDDKTEEESGPLDLTGLEVRLWFYFYRMMYS